MSRIVPKVRVINHYGSTRDARYTIEYRENGSAKEASFDNLHRADDFFQSCKADSSCSDIELHDNVSNRVLKRAF